MSGYIGPIPVPQGIQNKETFTATAGQTTFNTNGYTDGAFINVYLNGVRLVNGTDYTATNGSDIVLTQAASVSDVLDFETFNDFQLVSSTQTTPTFKNSATLKNDTEEDTDGGRESTLIFQGEQSGGEISTLAEIEASHDGIADDEKGDLIFRTNDGSDGSSPTEAMRINSDSQLLVGVTTAGSTNLSAVFATDNSTTSVASGNGAAIAIQNTNTTDDTYSSIYFNNSAGGTDSAIYGIHEDADATGTSRVGSMVFATAKTSGITEKMRIHADGYVTSGNQPRFMAEATGNASEFKAASTIHINNGSHYNNTTGLFTAPVSGTYYFLGGGQSSSSGVFYWGLYKNGSYVTSYYNSDSSDTYHHATVAAVISLDANDTMQFKKIGGVDMNTGGQNHYMGFLMV